MFACINLIQTVGQFYQAEEEHLSNPSPPLNLTITNYLSQYCYDATWAFAFTLNKTIAGLPIAVDACMHAYKHVVGTYIYFPKYKAVIRLCIRM